MAIENEDFAQSDDDFDDKKHEQLLDKVLTINKTVQLKKPSRTEPALQISEFDLAKSITGNKGIIHVGDLASVLERKKSHGNIKKKVEKFSKIASTLPKPLEKPVADKINRTVAYEKTRLELDRWEPIVTANRVSDDLIFPLPSKDFEKNVDLTKKWTVKTAFDVEMEKTSPQLVEEIHVDTQIKETNLTLKELKERRGELARMRARRSYEEAKARRQSKIKSKKYHRIQKKTKIKQQLKEFEELRKCNPDEALKRLDEIERIRAKERFSLRHKSTGKWAKHKQIHAKYDKESRAELAEQLRLSKELTQKTQKDSSDSEEEFINKDIETQNTITWSDVNIQPQPEVTNFINEYSKFCSKKIADRHDQNEEVDEDNKEEKEIEEEVEKDELIVGSDEKEECPKKKIIKDEASPIEEPKKEKKKSRKRKKSAKPAGTSEWDVELVDDHIDVIFDELEKKTNLKLSKEANKMKKELAPKKSSKKEQKTQENEKEEESLLALPMEKKRPRLDEPLLETSYQNETQGGELSDLSNILTNKNLNIDKNLNAPLQKNTQNNNKSKQSKKVTHLDNILPNFVTDMDDDDEDDELQKVLREEAADCFQDDLAQQFAKEKAETIEKDKPKDVNLFLPGWGCWGGIGIAPSKRKQRRFIVKAPKNVPRRDDNKGFLILNEEANKKAKEHMVDELPFPFQRVKDFEASIRAPVSRTFVPETAFRKLIKPAVKTKLGAIIEPMDKDVLLNKPKISK